MLKSEDYKEANAITHSGVFHADEVFATVFIGKIFPKIELCRMNNVPDDIRGDVIVYDLGGGKYDHHQRSFNECRENGIKYSSFGLLWREFGKEYLKKVGVDENFIDELYEAFDEQLVQGIDATDNGQLHRFKDSDELVVKTISLSNVISSFNPSWDETKKSSDDCFMEAVKTAEIVFDNFMRRIISAQKAKKSAEKAIEESKDQIMVLDRFFPWQEALFESKDPKAIKLLYVVFPSNRGGYNVQAVPEQLGGFRQRKPLPSNWSGLSGMEFIKKSGVEDATFCHNACFIAGAKTLKGALLLAQKAVENKED